MGSVDGLQNSAAVAEGLSHSHERDFDVLVAGATILRDPADGKNLLENLCDGKLTHKAGFARRTKLTTERAPNLRRYAGDVRARAVDNMKERRLEHVSIAGWKDELQGAIAGMHPKLHETLYRVDGHRRRVQHERGRDRP